MHLGLGEEGGVVDGDDDGPADAQRHRVMRRGDDVGFDLLGDEREPGLLPGEPCRTVGDCRRTRHHRGLRSEPPVALSIRSLAHHSEVCIHHAEGGNQAVDIATYAATVCGDRGGVHEHPWIHDSPDGGVA